MRTMTSPPTAAALPERLHSRDQWVCWRTQQRNDAPTKVPIVPGTSRFASTTDPSTWRSFETAREAVVGSDGDGIGFVFTADDPLVGVDLDDCRDPETATPEPWAQAVIDRLDSYTEVSPSGTGYHVLVRGDLPDGRNRAGDLELYDRARFFTVTGEHVAVTPATIEKRADALAAVHAEYVADGTASTAAATDASDPKETRKAAAEDPPPPETAPATGPAALADDELIDRAITAANGEKFRRLWRGDTGGYESHSEADMALCSLLAFWTGGDTARIDRLFRRSGLYREKWDDVHYADGTTYGAKTIERAVARTDETYTPPDGEASTTTASDETASARASTPDETSTPDARAGDSDAAEAVDGDELDATDAVDGDATGAANATTDATADAPAADPTTASTPAASTPEAAPSAPAGSRTTRERARLERIEELTTRLETLLAENERLREELATERDRRQELEAGRETDAEADDGWWPFG